VNRGFELLLLAVETTVEEDPERARLEAETSATADDDVEGDEVELLLLLLLLLPAVVDDLSLLARRLYRLYGDVVLVLEVCSWLAVSGGCGC